MRVSIKISVYRCGWSKRHSCSRRQERGQGSPLLQPPHSWPAPLFRGTLRGFRGPLTFPSTMAPSSFWRREAISPRRVAISPSCGAMEPATSRKLKVVVLRRSLKDRLNQNVPHGRNLMYTLHLPGGFGDEGGVH